MENSPKSSEYDDWDDNVEWDTPAPKTPEELEAERLAAEAAETRRKNTRDADHFERLATGYGIDVAPEDIAATREQIISGDLTYRDAFNQFRDRYRTPLAKKETRDFVRGNNIEVSDNFLTAADSLIDRGLERHFITDVVGRTDEASTLDYLDFCTELSPDNTITMKDGTPRHTHKTDFLRNYFLYHGIDETRRQGFRQFFDLMETDNPEINALDIPNNAWSVTPGRFGIADFKIHGLVSEVSPKNVRDLIQIGREIPTGDFHRFEQNRRDACAIQNVIIGGRDFIHDERPGVHETLKAMLDYYDARENPVECAKRRAELQDLLDRRVSEESGYYSSIANYALDLDNYSKRIERTVQAGNGTAQEYNETAAEILRRMVENTNPDTITPPETPDEKLNALLQNVDIHVNERTGSVSVDWNKVGDLVKYMNEGLISRQGTIGLMPSEVQALAFTERVATYAMRGVSGKDWRELPYDPTFKELVKFRDLTCSADEFSPSGFESFWQGFSRLPADPTDDDLRGAYQKLHSHVITQVSKLALNYASTPGSEYLAASLYSGNLTHELMGLVDQRYGGTLRDFFRRRHNL